MRKLHLSLEDLRVETFTPDQTFIPVGTVRGQAEMAGEEAMGGASIFTYICDTCPATCSGGCVVTECGSLCVKTKNSPDCYTPRTTPCLEGGCKTVASPGEPVLY